jgi:hypothetical protein
MVDRVAAEAGAILRGRGLAPYLEPALAEQAIENLVSLAIGGLLLQETGGTVRRQAA